MLSDFSIAMVETTRLVLPEARFVNCALPVLPFAEESFDLVIANHMLYHVEERQRGLAEIRRVLRDGGALFAATNGVDHLRELKELMREFEIDARDVSASFTLENAEEQFARGVRRHERDEYADTLRVTDPERCCATWRSVCAPPRSSGRVRMRCARPSRGERATRFYVAKSTVVSGRSGEGSHANASCRGRFAVAGFTARRFSTRGS